jgi:TatD DNase family protein
VTNLIYIDTHTHLDDEQFDSDREDVIVAAIADGISSFINIGYGQARWPTTIALHQRHPSIQFTLGLHPGNTDEWSPAVFARLIEMVRTYRPVAIGEIGLDRHWRDDNLDAQSESFRAQIDLALAEKLPIVIHQRNAGDEVAAILGETADDLCVALHSFDGHAGLAAMARDRGWMIGVGGLSTRRQNDALRSLLQIFPLQQIVLETDSPYLVPAGIKARRNSPSSIPLIAERLASLRGIDVAEVASVTTENATRYFGLLAKVGSA